MRGTDITDMKRVYRTVVEGRFPDTLNIELVKESDLRYGENPNQAAAMFNINNARIAELVNIQLVKGGKGGLSATNYMDVTRAFDVLKFFKEDAVAVMKHLIPSGFATKNNNSLDNIYINARDADKRSAFGSVVVFNRPLDKSTAEAIVSTYVEGVAAPEFEEDVMKIFEQKTDMRVIKYSNLDKLPKFVGDDTQGLYDFKSLPTGRVLVQDPYLTSIRGVEDLVLDPKVIKNNTEYVVARDPTPTELRDLLTAWYINIGVRSNGIVIVKDGVTLAVGSGQQERVGAVEQAIVKAYQKAMDREGIGYNPIEGAADRHRLFNRGIFTLTGAVVSSDAFFPDRDSIDTMGEVGITAVIQPGGSINDYKIIEAVNHHKMAMPVTRERCFGHF